MKNEQEIKALFFSQYWGQCIVQVSKGLSNNKQPVTAGLLTEMKKLDSPYLLLRTVEQLTDEEKYNLYYQFAVQKDGLLESENSYIDDYVPPAQYLLRIGILLPFTYLEDYGQPQILQPSDIIEKGWAKIKTT